jgi:hypothetical protein
MGELSAIIARVLNGEGGMWDSYDSYYEDSSVDEAVSETVSVVGYTDSYTWDDANGGTWLNVDDDGSSSTEDSSSGGGDTTTKTRDDVYTATNTNADKVSHDSDIKSDLKDVIDGDASKCYFRYDVDTGKLYIVNKDTGVSVLIAEGYSGYESYHNDTSAETLSNLGPLPEGTWSIGSLESHITSDSMSLTPSSDIDTTRSGMYIHGDNSAGDYSASTGCIILDPETRSDIGNSGVTTLVVSNSSST